MTRKAKPIKWTLEMLVASAANYQTRKAWEKGAGSAYKIAQKRGLLEECCGHMEAQLVYWTDDMLVASAANYQTRTAWATGDPRAYDTAHRRGLLKECCGHMEGNTLWAVDMLVASASKYETRTAWEKGDRKAYQAARSRGLLKKCCGHMEAPQITRSLEMLVASAAKYQTRKAWEIGAVGAYSAAQKRGLLDNDNIVGHMIDGSPSDKDTVYIWQAVDQYHQGLPVYKLGITSARLGDKRIKNVAKQGKFKYKIIVLTPVVEQATNIEKELLKLGTNPGYVGIDGASEFRALTDLDLAYAVSIIRANGVPNYMEDM